MVTYRDLALSYFKNYSKIFEVRGEDVPFWVNQFKNNGKNAIGLTGEDLYREFCLSNDNAGLKIIKKMVWNDSRALFKKPTLCLIGNKDKNLSKLNKELTVGICSKYKRLANNYLKLLEKKGYIFNKIYVNGSVELSCSEGIADLVIDIVYTGNSLKKYGLRVYDKIMESDFVIIGINSKEKLYKLNNGGLSGYGGYS